jgi:hypothetical protein
MRRRVTVLALALAALLVAAAQADVVQHGKFRVAVDATLTPKRLPRSGEAPVRFALSARFTSTKGSIPPQLRTIEVEINRHGHLDPGAVPLCRMEEIQPATSANALAACRNSLIGEGSFRAKVLFTQQSPFPSNGKLLAFNGRWHGRPAILAHIYGDQPIPTSNTIPFLIKSLGKGTYGTELSASIPRFSGKWGYVTGISLTLGQTAASHHARRSYLSAGCPAPRGINIVGFPLSRTSFSFKGHGRVEQTLSRSCRARG